MSELRDPELRGIIILHASAVVDGEEAFLFLGPSGAGKTTISQLLQPVSRLLADDRVYLVPQNGGWTAADGNRRVFFGPLDEGEASNLQGVPIRSIFHIFQAPTPHLAPLLPAQVCSLLVSATLWQKQWDEQVKRQMFSDLARIARQVSGYTFYFDRTQQTRDLFQTVCAKERGKNKEEK